MDHFGDDLEKSELCKPEVKISELSVSSYFK